MSKLRCPNGSRKNQKTKMCEKYENKTKRSRKKKMINLYHH